MFSNGCIARRVLMDVSNCAVRVSQSTTASSLLKDFKSIQRHASPSSAKTPLMTACNITAEVQASCPALDMSMDEESLVQNDVCLGSEESDLEDEDDEFEDEVTDSALAGEIVSGSDENGGGRNGGTRKRARRLPVEDFKYQVLIREGKITYACRACYATYRHKKSLNKHWRDKHAALGGSFEGVPNTALVASTGGISFSETPTSVSSAWINVTASSTPILDIPLDYKENVTNPTSSVSKRRLSVDTISPQPHVKRHKPLPVLSQQAVSSTTPVAFHNTVSAFRPPNSTMHSMSPNFPALGAAAAAVTNPFAFGFGSHVVPPQNQSHPNLISQQDAIARFIAAYQWNQVAARHTLNQQLLLSSSVHNQMESQKLSTPITCPITLAASNLSTSIASITPPVSSLELHNDQLANLQLQHQQHMPPDYMMPPPNLEHLQGQCEIGLSRISNEAELTDALDLTLSVKSRDNPLDLSTGVAAITSRSTLAPGPTPGQSFSGLRFSNSCGIPSNLLQPLAIYPPPIHDSYYSRIPSTAPFHLLPFLSPQLPQNMCNLARGSLKGAIVPDSLNHTLENQLAPPLPRVDTSPESNGSSSSAVDTAPSSSSSVSLKEGDSPYGADDERRRNGGRQPPTICMQCHQQFLSSFELNMHFRTCHLSQLALEFDNVKSWKTSALEEVHHNLDQNIVKLESGESIGFQCPECHYFAKWPTELQKHIMVHSDVRPHVCLICGSTYKWKWDLGRHFDKTHGGGVLMPNPYKKNGNVANNSISNSGSNESVISRANSVSLTPKVVTATTVTKELAVSPKLIQAVSNRLATPSVALPPLGSAVGPYPLLHSVVSPVSSIFSRSVRSILTSSSPKLTSAHLCHQQKRHSVLHEDNNDYQLIRNENSDDSLRSRLKKKIQQSACKRRSAPAACAATVCAHDAEFADDTDTNDANGGCPLPFVCPMCGFRARWKSELKSHATNHTTCKPFLCPFCQYRSKWKWDVVKHMKRCNWKKHDGGPPSVGPPIQISNKEMQALIIYKPPAKEEITNLAEAMLYADENSPFYEGRDTFDEDEDEMRNFKHNVSGASCGSVAVFPEPESLNPTSPTALVDENSSSSSSKEKMIMT